MSEFEIGAAGGSRSQKIGCVGRQINIGGEQGVAETKHWLPMNLKIDTASILNSSI
jgi:hypothetical protein